MSEANGTAAASTTFTQADIEKERAHAQHFKQIADENAAKLKAFEGVDVEEYKKTKAELDEMRKNAAVGDPKKFEEELSRREQEIRKQVQKDLDAREEKIKKLAQQNKELTVTDKVFAAAAPEVMPDMSDFIKSQIRANGDLNEKGEIVFKDENGKEMYAPGSTTQLMTTEQYVQHLRTKYPSSFRAADKGGVKQPGEKHSAYSGKTLTRDQIRALPDAEQKQYFRQNPAAATAYLRGQ